MTLSTRRLRAKLRLNLKEGSLVTILPGTLLTSENLIYGAIKAVTKLFEGFQQIYLSCT